MCTVETLSQLNADDLGLLYEANPELTIFGRFFIVLA